MNTFKKNIKYKKQRSPLTPDAINKRHQGLIYLTFAFLIMLLVTLFLVLSSSRALSNSDKLFVASQALQRDVQLLSIDTLEVRLSYVNNQQATFKNLLISIDSRLKKINGMVSALNNGKSIAIGNTTVDIPAIEVINERREFAVIEQTWHTIDSHLRVYLDDLTVDKHSLAELDSVIKQLSTLNKDFHDKLSMLADKIYERMTSQVQRLKLYELIATALTSLYLIVFSLIFVRRLRSFDYKEVRTSLEMEKIMATVNQGLFLIDSEMKVSEQYSDCLETLLGQKNIAGRRLDDLLRPIVSEKDLENTKAFVESLFEPRIKEKLTQGLNPISHLPVQITDENGYFETRYLSFSFSRVYENTEIKRLLISVSDITKSVLLQQQLEQRDEQNKQQIELLTSIMHADPQMLNTFIKHAHNATMRINDILRRSEYEQTDLMLKTKDIFREVHSLKGEASALELDQFVKLTHAFENGIVALQQKPDLVGNDFLSLTVSLEGIIDQLDRVNALIEHISKLSSSHQALPKHDTQALADSGNDNGNSAQVMTSAPRPAKASAPFINMGTSDALTSYFSKYVNNVSHRNNKSVELQTSGLDLLVKDKYLSENLTDIIVQLIRNAVVHGIETPEERIQAGKNETGVISIIFRRSDKFDRFELIVADDGSGILFGKIRKKLVTIGLCDVETARSLSKKQLVALLFDSGFSTITHVSEDAGRGVGLHVIKERVENVLDGKIQIDTRLGHHTRFLIYLPLEQSK